MAFENELKMNEGGFFVLKKKSDSAFWLEFRLLSGGCLRSALHVFMRTARYIDHAKVCETCYIYTDVVKPLLYKSQGNKC